MYELVYLPVAKSDIENIILYISERLSSHKTALNLLDAFEQTANTLKVFPYAHGVYKFSKPLTKEYRYVTVKNYIIFYTVFEDKKVVEIRRVLYGKMDFSKII